MLRLVCGYERDENPELFTEMFRQRRIIFHDQKKWDVKVTSDNLEIDEFDRDDTVYLCVMGPSGELFGSVRLLSTITDHMATHVFHNMFPGLVIRSPTIWEITRFVVFDDQVIQPNGISRTACELILGICQFGLDHGVTQVTSIYESSLHRVWRRCGVNHIVLGRYLGARPSIFFGLQDIDRNLEKNIRLTTGLTTGTEVDVQAA
ncbi:acyl-homoserine-lactone synthase [Beijerinckia indica]|uniref:Acyl-homoserine-lactone synthase n=1 Tax=Beijerinckia indica subsp. indica (strain ATCC 9039 / DSM 1715 / NCIMB 8712) TaxID=395963 RepID=B2IHP7_BEII9|nr:acyl-homoserine-lactone synthase [Beijerinckia indica]ACB94568.1 autoinducer synthesis protein [Beijerinckia indica subsp. indica ATCC 9039]